MLLHLPHQSIVALPDKQVGELPEATFLHLLLVKALPSGQVEGLPEATFLHLLLIKMLLNRQVEELLAFLLTT
jgi:hypothetical protein